MILTATVMRYRSFPVARHRNTPLASKGPPFWRTPGALTLLGALLVVGGLLRLATDETAVDVASVDLHHGPTRAASSEREAPPTTTDPAAEPPQVADPGTRGIAHPDPIDIAIVTMLYHGSD